MQAFESGREGGVVKVREVHERKKKKNAGKRGRGRINKNHHTVDSEETALETDAAASDATSFCAATDSAVALESSAAANDDSAASLAMFAVSVATLADSSAILADSDAAVRATAARAGCGGGFLRSRKAGDDRKKPLVE